ESARFESVLAEYRGAPDVTRARLYLESLRQVFPRVGSVLMVQDGQVPPLPLLNLRDAQPQRAPPQPAAQDAAPRRDATWRRPAAWCLHSWPAPLRLSPGAPRSSSMKPNRASSCSSANPAAI